MLQSYECLWGVSGAAESVSKIFPIETEVKRSKDVSGAGQWGVRKEEKKCSSLLRSSELESCPQFDGWAPKKY